MTKEEAMKSVEVAYQIYELLKQYPVEARDQVLSLVYNFNQADWREYHKVNSPTNTSGPVAG